jgi:hypothetical protein
VVADQVAPSTGDEGFRYRIGDIQNNSVEQRNRVNLGDEELTVGVLA